MRLNVTEKRHVALKHDSTSVGPLLHIQGVDPCKDFLVCISLLGSMWSMTTWHH